MKYVIFDDDKIANFYPITLTRSTGDLRVGILKLRQRIAAYLNTEKISLLVRDDLLPLYRAKHPNKKVNSLLCGEYTFVNSRLKINEKWANIIKKMPADSVLKIDNEVIAARSSVQVDDESNFSLSQLSNIFAGLKEHKPEKIANTNHLWNYIWELISSNAKYIEQDFADFFYDKDNYFATEMGVTILNPYQVWIGEGAELKPGVVIDASDGPIVIDEGVKILSNAVIIGPVFIGKNSVIKAGAKIYEGTSIGAFSKIGGEVEETIIQSYSNKQHDGFLGHSYIGEWVNLGANTNNSDLKNTYKNVTVYFYPENKKVDSGTQFLGAVIGDHVKTGISSSLNTGTTIGVGANLYGQGLIIDFVKSFSWGEFGQLNDYRIDKFLETAAIVKSRRGLSLLPEEKQLYEKIYSESY